ncbi:MAG: endonuclease III domain-containing protein [Candidatus Margulisiibacteriota bacterium]|jgi:endonuclease-3 related protein
MKQKLFQLYEDLYSKLGPQGWWPLLETGYHPLDFSYPKNALHAFEIALGAILTQNTNWSNVEKALINLKDKNILNPEDILKTDEAVLLTAIKPSGFFNQKLKKIKIFTDFFLKLKNKPLLRNDLLNLWGIGPETADSILLYAYKVPTFVVDTYTNRLLITKGLITEALPYHELKSLFENNLDKDYQLFQEFHALIVISGKIKLFFS